MEMMGKVRGAVSPSFRGEASCGGNEGIIDVDAECKAGLMPFRGADTA
jgi:hypothetical protein